MPVFFFHLKGGGLDFADRCGSEYSGPEHARAQALWFAREALLEAVEEGLMPLRAYVEVADEDGRSVFALPLRAVAQGAAPDVLRARRPVFAGARRNP